MKKVTIKMLTGGFTVDVFNFVKDSFGSDTLVYSDSFVARDKEHAIDLASSFFVEGPENE